MKEQYSARNIIGNAGALISGSGLARVFSALAVMIIARKLGPAAFGQYASSLSIVGLASVLFSLGLDGWLLRNGGEERDRASWATTVCLALKTGLGLAWLLAIFLLAPLLEQDTFPALLVYLSALSFWFDELTNTAVTGFKVAMRNHVTMWLLMGSQLVLLLITLGLTVSGVGGAGYLAGRMVASAVSAAFAIYLLLRYFGLYRKNFFLRRTLREIVPFALSFALAFIYEQADVTIVAVALGKTASGLYAPGITLARTLFLVPVSFYGVMLPILSQAYRSDRASVKPLATRFMAWSVVLGVAMGLGTALLADLVVRLVYGPQYPESGEVLSILAWVLAFRCLIFGLSAGLVAIGWQGRRVVVQAIAAAFNVGANLLIVQAFGIVGVAWVYVVTELILVLGHALLVFGWFRWLDSQPVAAAEAAEVADA